MSYATTTWLQLQTRLALRLADTANTFWTATEIQVLLKEALRTFGLISGFYRCRGTFSTAASTNPYVLSTSFSETATGTNTLAFSVTDRDIIQQVQYHLLESAASQAAWGGTEMFTYQDLVDALQRRLNRFLGDTGIIITVTSAAASVALAEVPIAATILDIRRATWTAQFTTTIRPMYREDERMITASDPLWINIGGIPESFSIMAQQPNAINIAPIPTTNGTVGLLVVQEGATLNPASGATALGIPDDLTPAIKWGVLADLLGKDGIARDPIRAAYCEQRYQEFVKLARLLPVIIHGEISGSVTTPCTIAEMDAFDPAWASAVIFGAPTDVVIAGPLLVYMNPPPQAIYTVTLDVVKRTPLPAASGDFVQLSEDQMDTVTDYAEHLALFKVGGVEWKATMRQAKNFLIGASNYNQRVAAAARAVFSAADQSEREKQYRPRRSDSTAHGTGAMKDVVDA